MNNQPLKITFNHVNPKVAEAFAFLANAMGVTAEVAPMNPPQAEVVKQDDPLPDQPKENVA